jgi:hypothetical protein
MPIPPVAPRWHRWLLLAAWLPGGRFEQPLAGAVRGASEGLLESIATGHFALTGEHKADREHCFYHSHLLECAPEP